MLGIKFEGVGCWEVYSKSLMGADFQRAVPKGPFQKREIITGKALG